MYTVNRLMIHFMTVQSYDRKNILQPAHAVMIVMIVSTVTCLQIKLLATSCIDDGCSILRSRDHNLQPS